MKFVVGDVHGEYSKLNLLIEKVLLKDVSPEFIFIGDYLDKGEDVYQTLRLINRLKEQYKCVFLTGNHEYLWLHLHDDEEKNTTYLLKYGGIMTMKSLRSTNLVESREKLLQEFGDFFSSLKPYYQTDGLVMVHSGIPPEFFDRSIKNIEPKDFLFNRYEFLQQERLYMNSAVVVFGHTGFFGPYYDGCKIGIDTAACFLEEQPLTAYCVEEMFFIDSFGNELKRNEIDLSRCPNIIRRNPWRYDA